MKKLLIPATLVGAGAAAALAFVLLQPGESQALIDPTDSDLVTSGAEIYRAECAACHGADLEGQPNWRQRNAAGRLPAPPHDASGHTWHHPDAHLFAMTKFGPQALVGEDYESDMPAYADILSDAEIRAVLSYIKSRWPDEVQARHDEVNQRYEAAQN